MGEFKGIMWVLIKYQQEQHLSLQKQQMENQSTMEELRIEIQRQNMNWINLRRPGHRYSRKRFFVHNRNRKKMFELFNRGQNIVNENTFFQNAIDNFMYVPEDETTFASYFRRYEDLCNTDCATWADFEKVCLLLRNFGTVEQTNIRQKKKKNSNVTFTETVRLLTELFSPKTSLFHKRWKCMDFVRKDN